MGDKGDDFELALARAESLSGSDPKLALNVLSEIHSPDLRRDHPEIAARAGYLRARLLAGQGEYQHALGAIRAARQDWLAAGSLIDAIRTDLGRATVLLELGDYQQAASVSEQVLVKLDELPAGAAQPLHKAIRAGGFGNRGNARNLMGDHTGAVSDYDVASNLYHALGERAKQAEMDANRAIAFMRLGMVHRALDDMRRSREVLLDLGLVMPATKCLIDMADGELLLGQPLKALDLLEESSIELERLNAFPEMARMRLVRARALLQMGLYGDAQMQASSAEATFTELNMMSETAKAARVTGWAAMEAGDLTTAAAELAVSERLFEACGEEGNKAVAWLLIARLERREGRKDDARERIESAIVLLERANKSVHVADAHVQLAQLAEDPSVIERHLAAAGELIDNFDIDQLRLPREAAVARLQRIQGDLEGSARTLVDALLTDRSRVASFGRLEFHVGAENVVTRMTADLIRTQLEIGTGKALARAWQAATLTKTMMLNQMRGTSLKVFSDGTERDPMLGLSMMYDDLRDLPPGKEREALARMVYRKQRALLRQGLIHHSSHASVDAPEGAVHPVPEAALLQFHVLGDDIVVFVIREGGVESRFLQAATGDVLSLLREWRAECSRAASAVGRAGIEEHSGVDLMHSFYKTLLEPVEDLLADLDGEPLMVIPHQFLFEVPFESIDCDGVPFAERYDLYFTSGTALESGSGIEVHPQGVAVFALPDGIAPAIEKEAHAIAAAVPDAEVFIGDEATADAFLTHAPGKDIVHIACHGEFSAASPLFSGLRLADRWVTGAEILSTDLRGTMVVISACDAGRSSSVHAEPVGLVWAFLAAGCRSVIASKWAVDDAVGTVFMTALHRHLAAGTHARHAVELARSEVRAQYPHPYYWAAFRYICSPTTALLEEDFR